MMSCCLDIDFQPENMPGNGKLASAGHTLAQNLDSNAFGACIRTAMMAGAAEHGARTPLKQLDMNAGAPQRYTSTTKLDFITSKVQGYSCDLQDIGGYAEEREAFTHPVNNLSSKSEDMDLKAQHVMPITPPAAAAAAAAAAGSTALASFRLSFWMRRNLSAQAKHRGSTAPHAVLLHPSSAVAKRVGGKRSSGFAADAPAATSSPSSAHAAAPTAAVTSSAAATSAAVKGMQAPRTISCRQGSSIYTCQPAAAASTLLQVDENISVLDHMLGPCGLSKHDVCYCIRSQGRDTWLHVSSVPKRCWRLVKQYNKARGLVKKH
jgi:hypothetical protein